MIVKGDSMIFPVALILVASSPNDHSSILAGQNILNFKPHRFSQTPKAAQEVGNRAAFLLLLPEPGQCPLIARNFELHAVTKQRGDAFRAGSCSYFRGNLCAISPL